MIILNINKWICQICQLYSLSHYIMILESDVPNSCALTGLNWKFAYSECCSECEMHRHVGYMERQPFLLSALWCTLHFFLLKDVLLMTLNLACLIGPVNYVIGAGTMFLLAPKAISALWHQGGWRGRKRRKCWNGLVVERERSQWMLSLLCRMLTHKL